MQAMFTKSEMHITLPTVIMAVLVVLAAAVFAAGADAVYVDGVQVGGPGSAAESTSYRAWTSTIEPALGTATVSFVHGDMPSLVLAADAVLAIDTDSFPTSGVSRVSLSVYVGEHSLTIPETITFAVEPELATDAWNMLLLRRMSDGAWKGMQL